MHFHGFDASVLLQNTRMVREYKLLFSEAAGIIAPSKFLARKLIDAGCPRNIVHVVGYGIDVDQFVPSARPKGGKKYIAVGRMVNKKAPDLTIKGFALVLERQRDAELFMVGEGPLLVSCQQLAERLGLRERVHFLGVQSHARVRELMQEADVFVQHSITGPDGDTEGLPVALLEAMASGLPVVSTLHSGIPEAVEDGATGLLVAEQDVLAMGRAMVALAEDPDRARHMGAAGRTRAVSHFSSKVAIEKLRTVLLHGTQLRELLE